MSRRYNSTESTSFRKLEYTLIAHRDSVIPDGEYKFNVTPAQLDGIIAGMYALESDNPGAFELYGPDRREINWEQRALGKTRSNYIVLPLSNEEAFERDIDSIRKHKNKRHIAILEMEDQVIIVQYDDIKFIDGLTTIFQLADLDLEDYIRPIPDEISGY